MMDHQVEALLTEARRLREQRDELVAVCRGYERWEADMITSADAWSGLFPDGSRAFPQLTEKLWDGLLDLQTKRNAAIAKCEVAP